MYQVGLFASEIHACNLVSKFWVFLRIISFFTIEISVLVKG
jgi:hypothetical protein